MEIKVRAELRKRLGRGRVDQVLPVEPGVWCARLIDGGLAYAMVEADGSITIEEQEVVCCKGMACNRRLAMDAAALIRTLKTQEE